MLTWKFYFILLGEFSQPIYSEMSRSQKGEYRIIKKNMI